MARADTITLIPLDRVSYHLQLDPWHFNGITSQTRRRATVSCDDTWYQHDWQASGKLSRESLSTALRQAEDVVISYLGWWLVPQWIEEEVIIPTYYKTEWNNVANSRNRAKSIVGSWGFISETGRKTSSLVGNTATVFSDASGDGVNDTVTITIATTVTTEDELRVYYPSQDGRDEWEIRPVTSIDITAGTATIVFPKYLIPLWSLVEQVPLDGDAHIIINGDDDSNFLATVDVYRVYSDPSQQITFTYDPSDGSCGSTPCAENTDTGCLFVRDSRRSIMAYQRSDWDADTEAYTLKYFSRTPIKGTIYYRAGKRDLRNLFPNRQVDTNLERMVSYYALSLLDTELCSCSNTRNIWEYLTTDLALVTRDESHVVQWDDLRNPLGTTRAALNLWKYIQKIRIAKSQVPT
jgi:hypothetical protein